MTATSASKVEVDPKWLDKLEKRLLKIGAELEWIKTKLNEIHGFEGLSS